MAVLPPPVGMITTVSSPENIDSIDRLSSLEILQSCTSYILEISLSVRTHLAWLSDVLVMSPWTAIKNRKYYFVPLFYIE